jgi:hypothetical protein
MYELCSYSLFSHVSAYKQRAQIHKHGGTVLPKFDPETATHIVTETNEKNTLRALGLKTLSEIPLEIPTVYWSWVISGKSIPGEKDKRQMDYEFMHAAFPSRMDAGRPLTSKGKGKQKLDINADRALVAGALQPGETSCVVSRVLHHLCLFAPSGALVHEQLLPTLHHEDRHAESTKRSQAPCWASWPGRHAKEGTQWSVRSMSPRASLLVTTNRLLAPAIAVNPARHQMHQPRAHRIKSQGSVPACMFAS